MFLGMVSVLGVYVAAELTVPGSSLHSEAGNSPGLQGVAPLGEYVVLFLSYPLLHSVLNDEYRP